MVATEAMEALFDRVAEVPRRLGETAELRWDKAAETLTDDIVVTGVGASSGPARIFTGALSETPGRRARFAPLCAFLRETPPLGRTLVVFSQGLSPNARLALRRADRYERVLVVTSTPEDANPLLAEIAGRGGVIFTVPPLSETGTFLRVVGPASATLAAICIAERGAGRAVESPLRALSLALIDAAGRGQSAGAHVSSEALDAPLAIVTAGLDPIVAVGLRWKWLEGLRRGEPAGLDALELVHGPLQGAMSRFPCVLLQSQGDASVSLGARVREVLSRAGHPLIALKSDLPFPWSIVDQDQQLNGLLVKVLRERPRDLSAEACAIADEPLYGLGREALISPNDPAEDITK